MSEIAELITKGTTPTTLGYKFQDEGVKFLKIESFDENGSFIENKVAHISEECHKKLKRSQLRTGDILFSIAGAIGRVAIVSEEMLPANTNQALAIIRIVNEQIYLPYIKLILASPVVTKQFEKKKQGVAQLNLSLKDINEISIPLPKKERQMELVELFDKISSVILKQNMELTALDTLIKARFVEMFGNPLNGTAKFPIHQVGEVSNLVDPQPSHRTPPVEENGVPYVSIKDCDYKTGKIDFKGARKVSRKVLEEHLNRYTLHEGDFVIGKIGTIGNPVFVPARDDYTLSANVVLVQPDREVVSPYFLKYSFESDFVERQFVEAKNSTSQAAFGIQKVRTVEVMNPDLDVQRRFEEFVIQVAKSKVAVQKALDEAQLLFDSLMQEYFG